MAHYGLRQFMSILFAHSFFMHFDEKQKIIKEPHPPLGTIIAAACAREKGYKVSLFDAMLAPDIRAFSKLLSSELIETVVFFEDNFNCQSKMCLGRMREACLTMIEQAVKAGIMVVVVGADASDYPEIYLKAGARYVIKGQALSQLMDLIGYHGLNPEGTFVDHGVYYLEEGQMCGQPPSGSAPQPFPKPAWDLINMNAYGDIWRKQHDYFTLSMVTTRGCPYQCSWCASPLSGKAYQVRDPLETAREMRDLKKRYKPTRIRFADDIFGLEPGWIEKFSLEINRLEAVIPFKIQARADLITPETAKALAAAGCREVWMGVESGSQKILDAMNKKMTVTHIHQAVKHLKDVGIHACFFLQLAYPGETAEDLKATWDLVKKARPYQISLSVAYPQLGTPFHQQVGDIMLEESHWEYGQALKPVFKTTYPAEIYPLLYRYFHQLFWHLNSSPGVGPRRFRAAIHRAATRRRLAAFGIDGIPFN